MKKLLTNLWIQVTIAAIGAALIRYYPFLLGKTLFFGDNYSLLVPGKIWTAYWLKQGILPLWNPNLFSGLSWVGDISQTPLSPTVLPFVLVPPALALNSVVIGYFLLTFFGMYFLTRSLSQQHWWSLVAGGLWASSSIWLGGANNLATLQSLSWFPWILWGGYTLRWSRWSVLRLALLIAGQAAAGYPQHLFLSLPAAAYLSLANQKIDWRKWLASWSAAVALAFGLTAPLALPFLITLLNSTRQLQTAEQAARGSLHPAELIKILLPCFFDAPRFGIRWGPNWNFYPTNMPYLTWFGFGILVTTHWKKLRANRLVIWLAGGALAGLILSFGSHLPGFVLLLSRIPGLSTIRYPSSWLVITELFSLSLLACTAGQWKPGRFVERWLGKILLTSLLTSLVGLFFWQQYPDQTWQVINTLVRGKLAGSLFHTLERDRLIATLIFANLTLNSFLGLLAWKTWKKKLWPVLAGLLIVEGVINSQALALFASAEIYAKPSDFESLPLVEALRDPQHRSLTRNLNFPYTDYGSYWEAVMVRQPFSDSFVDQSTLRSGSHLIGLRDGLTPDWNLVANVPIVNGYTTLLPANYQNIWEKPSEARINLLSPIDLANPLLSEWATKYYVVDRRFEVKEDLSKYPEVYRDDRWVVYEFSALNRFRYGDDSPAALIDLKENPNSLIFRIDNSSNQTQFIIADRFESGWRAKVNGRETIIENQDGMRTIPIASGNNEIELFFLPNELVAGLILSAFAWLTIITLLVSQKFGSERQSDAKLRRSRSRGTRPRRQRKVSV